MNLTKKLTAVILVTLMLLSMGFVCVSAAPSDAITVAPDYAAKTAVINIDLPQYAGSTASLVCLDPSFVYDGASTPALANNSSSICALRQITLDNTGKASYTVKLATVASGSYTVSVGVGSASFEKQFAFEATTLTAVADKAAYETGSEILITAVSSANVKALRIVNENGIRVSSQVKSCKVIASGEKEWVLSLSVQTKGTGRVLTINGYVDSATPAASANVTFDVKAPSAALIGVVAPTAPVVRNVNFRVVVTTSTEVKLVSFSNATGMNIGKTLVSRSVVNGVKTWNFDMKLGTAGTGRVINVSFTDFADVKTANAAQFTVDITKA